MNIDTEPAATAVAVTVTVAADRPLAELTDAVETACDQAEAASEQTVVVFHARATPGFDREWPGTVTIQEVNRWERAVRRVERLGRVSIVGVEGACGGPALDLLLAADYRIAGPDLSLMLPVNEGHFWPGMAVYRLVQHLGVARARQLVMWGSDLSLVQATELGLIDHVSEDVPAALRTASLLNGRLSDREMAVRRQLLLEAAAVEYDDALGIHLAACDRELRRLADRPGRPLATTVAVR